MSGEHWAGVDLGGTKILAGVFTDDLRLLARAKLPTNPAAGPNGVFGHIRQAVDAALKEANVAAGDVRAIGMCVPGQIDPVRQRVKYAPNLNWKDLDLVPLAQANWPWPSHFGNDVVLGTFGEFLHGAAKGAQHVLGIFVGTGVGGGLILNGEIYHGFNFNAGEIGHIIVHWRKGTELEAVAGRRSIAAYIGHLLTDAPKKRRKNWKGVDPATLKSSHLAEFYNKDDPIAVQVIDDAARALGAAVGSAINLLSPEVIVIGGGLAGALGEPFLERIWELALRYALPQAAEGVRCVPAALGDDAGIVGAAAHARRRQTTAG